ncbi:GL26324 [Drosophila persimilis]|uniref:GL26324 n=1 Tax=Drosophila persimilis TaxID=7234 RepID=B4GS72_DROPE|nr:GL26324 [Drosophila persimilis]
MPPPPGEAAPMAPSHWPYPYPYPPPAPAHHAVEGKPAACISALLVLLSAPVSAHNAALRTATKWRRCSASGWVSTVPCHASLRASVSLPSGPQLQSELQR